MAWKNQAYLCSDMISSEIQPPLRLMSFLTDPEVEICNDHEAFLCILNVLLLEENFVPAESYKQWKKGHYYSLSFSHPTTENMIFQLKYLPVDETVIIFATIQTRQVAKLILKPKEYVKDFTQMNACKMYINVHSLSIKFKDTVIWPVLSKMQEAVDVSPTFGLTSIADEIKLQIVHRMDIHSILALSATNKQFRSLIENPYVWKRLLFRDFPCTSDQKGDWKQIYKSEYCKKSFARSIRKELKVVIRPIGFPVPALIFPEMQNPFLEKPGPSRRHHDLARVNFNMF